MKSSRIKAEIVRRSITSCAMFRPSVPVTNSRVQPPPTMCTSKSPQTAKSRNLLNFKAIHQWTKDISPIRGYWFMKLYQYLIKSTDSTFDKESMRAVKFLKAYKYFADGLVRNVWAHHLEDQVVVRGYCRCSRHPWV